MSLISVFEEDIEEVTNPKNHAKPEEEIEYEEDEDEIEEDEEE
jgi:hypothetical protein